MLNKVNSLKKESDDSTFDYIVFKRRIAVLCILHLEDEVGFSSTTTKSVSVGTEYFSFYPLHKLSEILNY